MLTIYSNTHQFHHGVELKDGKISPSFESPSRARTILERVHASRLGEVMAPEAYDVSHYAGAHSERYVSFLATAWQEWSATGRPGEALPLIWPVRSLQGARMPEFIDGKLGYFSMDAGAPIGSRTWEAVAAIAAARARANGARRVAVVDVDFHHGNGTQDIFYARGDVFFTSLHGDPATSYPYFAGYADETGEGEGLGCNLNLPLPHGTAWSQYSAALEQAMAAVKKFGADVLIVSLGVDTFEGDPISHFRLKTEDYLRMGEMLALAGLPALFVMEGGYMVDAIGVNAVNVLRGFEEA